MDMDKKERLRSLYKVDEVLQDECLVFFKEKLPYALVADSVRKEIGLLRAEILNEDDPPAALTERQLFLERVIRRIQTDATPSLCRVINATGTILHTNLGRSPLSEKAIRRVVETACSYSTLEYDLKTGRRGSRHDHVRSLICRATGAESAMVVNNNAAATMLVLSSMADGREVVVSRGELVEIGGSFRIPDIMSLSGVTLREVGTTNKTHLSDYVQAIDPERTAALMKVHTSNYRIIGFTDDVPLSDLRKLGDRYDLPVIYDMGNGLLADLKDYKIFEPSVTEAMRDGADIMLFSGDKLLGGPQAGIIIGKKKYIEKMERHPLARVVRIDKMTLSALEAVFFGYQDMETAMKEIPTLQMLTCPKEDLYEKARLLAEQLALADDTLRIGIESCEDLIGGGSAPDVRLAGYAVTLHMDALTAKQIEYQLRKSPVPIISHICQDRVWLHMRTIMDKDIKDLVESVLNLKG